MELSNKVQVIFTAQKEGYKQSYISSNDPKIKLANSRNHHLPFIRCNQIYRKDKHLDINQLQENQKSHPQLLHLFNTQNIRDKSYITKNTLENSKLNKSQITSYYGTQQQNIDINKYGRTIQINTQAKQTKKRSLIIQNQNTFDNFRRRSLFYNDQNNYQQLINQKKRENFKSLKTPKFSSSTISNHNQQKITNSIYTSQDITPLFYNKNLTFGQIIGKIQYDKSMDLNQRDSYQSDIYFKNTNDKLDQGNENLSKKNYQRGIIGLMSPKNNFQRKSNDIRNQQATRNSKISYYVQKNQQVFMNQLQGKSKMKNNFQQNYNKSIQHQQYNQKNMIDSYKKNYAQLSKQRLNDFQNYSSSKKHDLQNHHFTNHKQNIYGSQISDYHISLQGQAHKKDSLSYKRYGSINQQKTNVQHHGYYNDYKQKQAYSEDEKQLAYYKIQLQRSRQRQQELQQMLNQQIRHSSQLQRQLLRSIKKSDVIEKPQIYKTDKKQFFKQNVNRKQAAQQFKEACKPSNGLIYFTFMLILMIKYGIDTNNKHY